MRIVLLEGVRVLCIGMLLLLFGCEHKTLCYEHLNAVYLNVVFDWSKAPEASPKSMSLYLFPIGGGKPIRYEFAGREGGTIRVPRGTYEALCLNSDTRGIDYLATERRTTFEVTTYTTGLLSRLDSQGGKMPYIQGKENERVALEPERLWSDHQENITLKKTDDGKTVIFYPETSMHTYVIEIRNVENLQYASKLSASISTMAGGMFPGIGSDALSEERVTIPFSVAISADKATITGRLQSFGHCPSDVNSHKLVVYAVLEDGSKWYYTYDVTQQLHAASNPQNVLIALDGLPLPKPIGGSGGGFDPSVDDWEDITVDIEM